MNLSIKNIVDFPISTVAGLLIVCLVIWKTIFWVEGRTIQAEHTISVISLIFNAGIALLLGKKGDNQKPNNTPTTAETGLQDEQDEQGNSIMKIVPCLVYIFVFNANFAKNLILSLIVVFVFIPPLGARGQLIIIPTVDITVLDGDTFEWWEGRNKRIFRICNIDAPEKTQPYGITAKNALETLINAVDTITAKTRGTDIYRRELVEIDYLDSTMIANGNAWHYKEYSYKPYLQTIQGYAELYFRGLWNCNPVTRLYPSVWRKLKKKYKRLTVDKEGCL